MSKTDPSGSKYKKVVTRLPYDKRPKRLPAVRSPQQVALFLDTVRDRIIQMVLRTIYYLGN